MKLKGIKSIALLGVVGLLLASSLVLLAAGCQRPFPEEETCLNDGVDARHPYLGCGELVPPPEALLTPPVCPPQGPVINFPDPALELLIRDVLGEPYREIHRSDLQRFIELRTGFVRGRGDIRDITGLEHLVNLRALDLRAEQIQEISPLAGLINLEYLCLVGNDIEDLSPLANLRNLQYLDLGGNRIMDITPLANLANLRRLCLAGNHIEDIGPLADLVNLEDLNLDRNHQLEDISPLANLVNLKTLRIQWNRVKNVSPLAYLTNLESLMLRGNRIEDISPLANLVNLRTLWLCENRIRDISALAELTNLGFLMIEKNRIKDITALAYLTNLWELNLRWNYIEDISPLVQNAGLDGGHRIQIDAEILEPGDPTTIVWGDSIRIGGNPLSADSVNIYIPELERRGVRVCIVVPHYYP